MLLSSSILATLAVAYPLLTSALSVKRQDDVLTTYKPPILTPFLHMNILVGAPVNASTLDGITARVPNLGGRFLSTLASPVGPEDISSNPEGDSRKRDWQP